MNVLMTPFKPKQITSGIDNVVLNYQRHLPAFGITVVDEQSQADLWAIHIYAEQEQLKQASIPIVVHNHGLHWSDDYPADRWQWYINGLAVQTIRHAAQVTVPSAWVAETFQRDMRFSPHVIPHGIDWQEWEPQQHQGFVLWNKNRPGDVCTPEPVMRLAERFSDVHFKSTFATQGTKPRNLEVIGIKPHQEMRALVQASMLYLSTTKETFGIGVLEAMASAVPVLGWRHGGNVDLIQHGVNGYLAEPGDYDDLAQGFRYCLQYRDALGANGREMAKEWTWERACEMVAGVYRLALEPRPATASVVIPFYNKTEEQLGRAIRSALAQDYGKLLEIIVVDDGSSNPETAQNVVSAIDSDKVRLYRKSNGGVATARNYGIEQASGEYVACLDADDAMGPSFVSACVAELKADPSLGIAYSAILAIKPDGSAAISQWPYTKPVYDDQFAGKNQIPTCCVFRREMWQRLGGYRQRYAHHQFGAGAEDAEFWLRAMAYGYGAKMVSETAQVIEVYHRGSRQAGRPLTDDEMSRQFSPEKWQRVKDSLFIYSLGGGLTSQPGYNEINWLPWHPWNNRDGDDRHPLASMATPASKMSHPVRQYDEPLISVVIPVGPGHEDAVTNALDSLEAQTFRGWEAVVVWDAGGQYGTYPDEYTVELNMPKASKELEKAYPYIRLMYTGPAGCGAGVSRNLGANIARGQFVVFLDADDWLAPECLELMLAAWSQQEAIIYTDYVNRSIIDTEYLNRIQRAGRYLATLKDLDDGRHLAVYWSEALDYNCELAQVQPRVEQKGQYWSPYSWCLMTTLIPKVWHNTIGGFDESMSSFEDVDYHWRLARAGYCYARVAEQLVIYNYHLGHRRESGRQNFENLLQYITDKYREVPAMGCSGCGGKSRRAITRTPTRQPAAQVINRGATAIPAAATTGDEQWIMCEYHPQKGGKMQCSGVAHFDAKLAYPDGRPVTMITKDRSRPIYCINYGQRQPGDVFLVHRLDVERSPLMFQPLRERVVKPIHRGFDVPPPPPEPEPVIEDTLPELPPAPITRAPAQIEPEWAQPDDLEPPEEGAKLVTYVELQKLPGVGKVLAQQLERDGLTTAEDILDAGVDGLKTYDGVGEFKARAIIKAVQSRIG